MFDTAVYHGACSDTVLSIADQPKSRAMGHSRVLGGIVISPVNAAVMDAI